ncbi:unnamed protein product, partial [Adineta ricciae]
MNSLPSPLIINTRNHNKRTSLTMLAQSNSVIKSSSVGNDYFVKYYTSNHCSMFDEQINSNNQRKDDDNHHQYCRSVVITDTSSNFRPTVLANNHRHHHYTKRYRRCEYIS